MSWIQKLCETYDNCLDMVGTASGENEVPLLPLCHTTQMAQVEIVLDGEGHFRRARVVSKNEARTIIPCTESSSGRTNNEAPHPLCDKLQYVASDYQQYGGGKKSYHASFLKQLEDWCRSEHQNPKAIAILKYVQKGSVIGDLIRQQILITDNTGTLIEKPEKDNNPIGQQIFTVLIDQSEAFIRWVVEDPTDMEPRVYKDETLWSNWIAYYQSTRETKSLCLVTGEEKWIAEQHPAKLINDGDKAKIISSNDNQNFTFRGRFITAEQAATTSLEASQKAHAALRWLISRQGYRESDGSMAVVAWATSGASIPNPTDDAFSLQGSDELLADRESVVNTAQDLGIRLKKKIAGYIQILGETSDVVVLALSAATPKKGRMAITFYQELQGSTFLERLNYWHESCAWVHSYRSVLLQNNETGKPKSKRVVFVGAPSPQDIAEAAYGLQVRNNITLKTATIHRLLPCIIDGQQLPRDLVESAFRRACNRNGLEKWEWEKVLTITCAMYRKYNRKERYDMTLDINRTTRDYLYGRLLALAEYLEQWSLSTSQETRETNAARLMQRFSEHPFTTWRTIELALAPHKARLGRKAINRLRLIDNVMASFIPGEFINDKRLSGEFLLGYHCQREAMASDLAQKSETETE